MRLFVCICKINAGSCVNTVEYAKGMSFKIVEVVSYIKRENEIPNREGV